MSGAERDGPAEAEAGGEQPATEGTQEVPREGSDPGRTSEAEGAGPDPNESSIATRSIGVSARFAGRTAVGLVREHNEDNLLIADLTARRRAPHDETRAEPIGAKGCLFAVCDGMGGAAAGEVASQMAVDTLFDFMGEGEPAADRDVFARRLVAAVEHAGHRIFETAKADRSRRGMGTTATVAGLMSQTLFVAQVGDSRAYLLRGDRCTQLTKDQSLVNQLIEAGHLTEEEAEAFEHSNIILQALGTSESVQVDLTFAELREGDRVMLCSDGLSGLVHGEVIADVLREIDDPAECCDKLIELANAGGGHDNITVIVADFTGPVLEPPKETDAAGYMQYPLMPEEPDQAKRKSGGDSTGRTQAEVTSTRRRWALAGLAATAILVAVVLGMEGEAPRAEDVERQDIEAEPDELAAAEAEPAEEEAVAVHVAPEPDPQAQAEPALLPVRIRTDVEDATLFVNGEARGALAPGEVQTLELPPGAYRFEAHSAGSVAAKVVMTLDSEEPSPRRVELVMPTGSTGGASSRAAAPRAAAKPRDGARALARPRPSPADEGAAEPRQAPADGPRDPDVQKKPASTERAGPGSTSKPKAQPGETVEATPSKPAAEPVEPTKPSGERPEASNGSSSGSGDSDSTSGSAKPEAPKSDSTSSGGSATGDPSSSDSDLPNNPF